MNIFDDAKLLQNSAFLPFSTKKSLHLEMKQPYKVSAIVMNIFDGALTVLGFLEAPYPLTFM